MSPLATLLPLSIALWSGYALSLSISSIQNVRTYEEPVEKAAKYSNIVEDSLKQTQTTEGAGAAATLLSLATSLTLAVAPFLPSSLSTTPHPAVPITFSLLNALGAHAARVHIHNFWRKKKKVPLVDKYNTAIDTTNALRRALGWMSLAWGVQAVGQGLGLMGY